MKRGAIAHCPGGDGRSIILRTCDTRLTGGNLDQESKPRKARNSIFSRFKGESSTLKVSLQAVAPADVVECAYGDIFDIPVQVSNEGSEALDSSHPFHADFLSYHWEGPGGDVLIADGIRTPLLGVVHPGQTQVVRLRVSAAAESSEAVLVVDMVREGVSWFAELGGHTMRLPCSIGSVEVGAGVGDFWGRRAEVRTGGEFLGWLDHPVVSQECVLPRLGGGDTHWILGLMRLHGLEGGGRWLSLGCGEGGLELWLVEQGAASSINGVDLSEHAVEIANEAAASRGLESAHFSVADLNREDLPAEEYDVVIASMAMHHIERLEDIFEKIYGSLKDGGYFFASEYVGPNRFNFPEEQLALANSVIAILPKDLTHDVMASRSRGTTVYKYRYVWRSPEQWLKIDPSEAVRSSEIIGVMRETFDQSWVYEYGGPLLHLVLENIAANFDPEDERDRALIRMMYVFETALVEKGYLNNDFAHLAARKASIPF